MKLVARFRKAYPEFEISNETFGGWNNGSMKVRAEKDIGSFKKRDLIQGYDGKTR